jgi:DNA-binding NarL/FixJ family response regulator
LTVIGLVDPRELTRHCLEQWLLQAWPGCDVVTSPAARPLVEMLRRRPGLRFILVSVSAGQASSPETLAAVAQLRRAALDRPVILLAEGERASEVSAALRAGARGYVPTSLDRAAAVEAINFVLAGGTFIPAGAMAEPPGRAPLTLKAGAVLRLSPRELEVVSRLREGKANKTIAYELSISESTVKVFVRRILAKLGAANRTEAVAMIERTMPPHHEAAA